jgi:hypothetical protein
MVSGRRSRLGLLAAGVGAVFLPGRQAAGAQEPSPSGPSGRPSAGPGLLGAWLVTVSRPTGQGAALLTFTSDGTFFRSADTHPVQSVGHGVWTPVDERDIDAMYIALRFDETRAHIGSQKTRLRLTLGPDPDRFTAVGKVSTLAVDGSVQGTSQTQLQGERIGVEAFDA